MIAHRIRHVITPHHSPYHPRSPHVGTKLSILPVEQTPIRREFRKRQPRLSNQVDIVRDKLTDEPDREIGGVANR
jgi:hypothetical protein